MGYENYTTYTEEDTVDDRLQFSANHIDIIARRDEDVWLVKDKGVDHFGSTFEHLLDAEFISASTSGSLCVIWALSNYVEDMNYWRDNAKSYYSLWFYGTISRLYLCQKDGVNVHTCDYTTISRGTPYYLKIIKATTSLICEIYSSDALRTTGGGGDVDDLSRTVVDTSFQYIFACNTLNTGNSYISNTDIDNLDLQEAPPVVPLGIAGNVVAITKILDIISLVKPKFKPLFPKFTPRIVI